MANGLSAGGVSPGGPASDLKTGHNLKDEVVVVFADVTLLNTPGSVVAPPAGTPTSILTSTTATQEQISKFKNDFAHALAYTIAHESSHSFGLRHTGSTDAGKEMMATVDIIHGGVTPDQIIQNLVVTRAPLDLLPDPSLGIAPGATNNNYDQFSRDPDIGLVDRNGNHHADFAYVTGTGAHDTITLTADGTVAGHQKIKVVVSAYSDPSHYAASLIRSFDYSIVLGVDTDGGIRIDASVGDDVVTVASGLNVPVTVYGGQGNDSITGGAGDDWLSGEDGNDTIVGGAGVNHLYGGDDNDTLIGGDLKDFEYGGKGQDTLIGNGGEDELHGGDGNDSLRGEGGNDTLHRGDNDDYLYGEDDNDLLYGDSGNDELHGLSGWDELHGGNSDDRLFGEDEPDRLFGDAGNDMLYAGAGDDRLEGGRQRQALRRRRERHALGGQRERHALRRRRQGHARGRRRDGHTER